MVRKLSEYSEQCLIIEWCEIHSKKYPELKLLNASLNGVKLTIGQAVKASRSGMRRGYPDLFLPVAKQGFHGMFIELKINKNRTSVEQKWWLDQLNNQGYFAEVCYGANDAIQTIKNYLQIE